MVHCDTDHLADAAAVENFDFVKLGLGQGPGITSPEEDVNCGGDV